MPQPEKTRILIVEDDPGTASLHMRTIERAGYEGVPAGTVEEAERAIRAARIDLVILDNRLPNQTTGIDFLARLRTLAPELPVIMVTGSEVEGAVVRALRGGVRDFIRKDLDYLDHLPDAIGAVLRTARLEAQLEAARTLPRNQAIVLAPERDTGTERRELERTGFEVHTAHHAARAIEILGEFDIALMVIDREAPPVGGLDAYARVKAAGYEVRAILVGGEADEKTAVEALRAGFADLITAKEDYPAALREALERVSARLTLEMRLAASRARLTGIVNSAMDAILLLDDRFCVSMINPAAEQMFGVAAREASGEKVERFIQGLEAHLTSPDLAGQRARMEARGLGVGGKQLDLEISLSVMEAHGSRFFTVIARNVTERRELERLLLQKDKLESLGLLAGGIAHDFNNLLVGIMGNASLALETISTNNPARAMLRDVTMASETAANLTRQLLAYAGKGRFITEAVDLSDLIRQISTLLQTSIPKNAQLRLELSDSLPCVDADVAQMQQILMNLVINAAEAIGEAQGTIVITTRAQHVDGDYIATVLVPAQIRPGDYVTVQVQDSGSGMAQETVDRIFDPFFTTKATGRGLGLAAVLGIVRGHKGAIKVYSTRGKGTTFKLLFPATGGQAVKHEIKTPGPASRAGETVLVVDDEQIVRRSAKAMLERFGYSVVLAENGKEAVDLFRILADKIDLVLLDMTMPVMNGDHAFRELKTIRPEVRVILSSGYNEGEAIRRFAGKGLAGFIQKPYSAIALAEKVRAVLSESRGASQS